MGVTEYEIGPSPRGKWLNNFSHEGNSINSIYSRMIITCAGKSLARRTVPLYPWLLTSDQSSCWVSYAFVDWCWHTTISDHISIDVGWWIQMDSVYKIHGQISRCNHPVLNIPNFVPWSVTKFGGPLEYAIYSRITIHLYSHINKIKIYKTARLVCHHRFSFATLSHHSCHQHCCH